MPRDLGDLGLHAEAGDRGGVAARREEGAQDVGARAVGGGALGVAAQPRADWRRRGGPVVRRGDDGGGARGEDASGLGQHVARGAHAVDHVEEGGGGERPVGERERGDVAGPEVDALRGGEAGGEAPLVVDHADALPRVLDHAALEHRRGDPQHRQVQVHPEGEPPRPLRERERRPADGAAEVHDRALGPRCGELEPLREDARRRAGPRLRGGLVRVVEAVVVPRVAAQLVADRVEERRRAAAVAEDGLERLREVVPHHHLEDVVREQLAQVRHDDRDAVDDGVLALAGRARAEEHALDDDLAFGADRGREGEGMDLGAVAAADGAVRAQRVEVAEAHLDFPGASPLPMLTSARSGSRAA